MLVCTRFSAQHVPARHSAFAGQLDARLPKELVAQLHTRWGTQRKTLCCAASRVLALRLYAALR